MNYKFRILGLMILLGGITMLPLAKAEAVDQQTMVTISGPVEVSGVVLPAGQYIFRLADNSAGRNIVEIFNEDQSHLITTIMAIPATRPEPTGDAVITLDERPNGSPEAIAKWFFAGETEGVEFPYHQ